MLSKLGDKPMVQATDSIRRSSKPAYEICRNEPHSHETDFSGFIVYSGEKSASLEDKSNADLIIEME